MSQLTITLDDDLLRAAQAYAHRQGQELDAWVAQTLANALLPVAPAPVASPTAEQRLAILHRLAGSLTAPADFDYKKELAEGLDEKFSL